MSPEKSKQLIEIYPELFDRDNIRNLVTMFGIECGDGWFELLKDCLTEIKAELDKNPYTIDEFFDGFKIDQIKEKYGTLRLYITPHTDEISEIIEKAELRSEVTCESCGATGKLRGGVVGDYWMRTSCQACENKKGK